MCRTIWDFIVIEDRDAAAVNEIGVTTKPYASWNEIKKMLAKFDRGWIFRCQRYADWSLQTSLETWKKNNWGTKDRTGNLILEQIEEGILLKEFKREANNYFSSSCQKPGNTLEWLALMQHYGCPTRLLDFTYSPYVAAFFAFDECYNKNGAIWCVNADWCKERSVQKYNKEFHKEIKEGKKEEITILADFGKEETFQDFWKNPKALSMVFPVNPAHANERLAIQQGVFLCTGSSQSFKGNIDAMSEGENHYLKYILKIVVSSEARKEAIVDLNRMNINNATLFPGLEGYAKSLKDKFWIEGSLGTSYN
ncbi:MAG: FRG domain-containing protein [Candidatus Omnitrophica bacterium]|nr:FRG domain-containing protein [Candidatus Omnitrophota bacterium]MBU4479676.1 FRG domain-containing protein [Candidatus Omnitrophota bacterium]MCG2703100.1 FRG domain-containing protein [Candidatus Omnitrophota bacterium]